MQHFIIMKLSGTFRHIVWNESTMAHTGGLKAFSRILKDIRGNEVLRGGATVLLADDFWKTLPVAVENPS